MQSPQVSQQILVSQLNLATTNLGRLKEFQRISDLILKKPIPVSSASIQGEVHELQVGDAENLLMLEGKYAQAQLAITAPKLADAFAASKSQSVMVADAGVYLHGLAGFPGPNIKLFMNDDLQLTKLKSLCYMANKNALSNPEFTWVECIGFQISDDRQIFVTGSVSGKISTEPSPMRGFGFDDILIVNPALQVSLGLASEIGQAKTLTELMHEFSSDIKHSLSARAVALAALGTELRLDLTETGQALLKHHKSHNFTQKQPV